MTKHEHKWELAEFYHIAPQTAIWICKCGAKEVVGYD